MSCSIIFLFFFWSSGFRGLLKTSNHSGVEGHIIQNIKNQIDLSLKVRKTDEGNVSEGGTPVDLNQVGNVSSIIL